MKRYSRSLVLLALGGGICTQAVALESTASGGAEGATGGLSLQFSALQAALTAAINVVATDVSSMMKCSETGKFYKPASTNKDANGCVGSILKSFAQTVPVPGSCVPAYGNSCPATTVNLSTYASANSVSFSANCMSGFGNAVNSAPIPSLGSNWSGVIATCGNGSKGANVTGSYSAASKILTVSAARYGATSTGIGYDTLQIRFTTLQVGLDE